MTTKVTPQFNRRNETLLILQEASNNFNLGSITSYEKLDGNLNKNYLVLTENGYEFIFKILLKHSLRDLITEIIYLDRLSEYAFPAGYYIKDKNNSSIFHYKNNTVVVQTKINGKHPLFTSAICYSIGLNIAKLHQISTINLPIRNHWLKKSFLPRNISLLQKYFPLKTKKFTDAFELLGNFEYSNLPKTIVHGDLYENNCLYEGNNLMAILDWEEVGIAPAVLDLATCIYNFCFEDNSFNPKLYKTMIDGYQQIRPLSQLEKQSLNLAIKYVGLNLSSWRLLQFGYYKPNPIIVKKHKIYWSMGLDKLQLPQI